MVAKIKGFTVLMLLFLLPSCDGKSVTEN